MKKKKKLSYSEEEVFFITIDAELSYNKCSYVNMLSLSKPNDLLPHRNQFFKFVKLFI